MKTKFVITLGREFCSGGAEVGKKVAEYFGIPYYDKHFIDNTAEVLKCSADIVKQYDEKPSRSWGTYGFQYGMSWYATDPMLMMPIGIKIADAQFEMLKKLAEEGPCVIVGRCGDFLLKEKPNIVRIFIRSDLEERIKRAKRLYNLKDKEAEKLIKKTDKIRADYHNSHTSTKWGDAHNYDIVINTAKCGIDNAVKTIISYLENLENSDSHTI